MKPLRVIGLMSGTSLDGIDAALVRTDGAAAIACDGFVSLPYPEELRARIRAVFNVTDRAGEAISALERDITDLHAAAVRQLLAATGCAAADIDLIGFHGQTISHAPERGFTCQLGDGALLARLTGIRVVNDFRSADVAAGGQGAPLVPVYHQALTAAKGLNLPVAFLNIGGVANVTFVGTDGTLIAFDTGPGNALIDDLMLRHAGAAFDAGGATAAAGRVDAVVLTELMKHAYFAAPVPKSLDRNAFASTAWEGLSLADAAATLTAFTAESIAASVRHLPQAPGIWVVAGGGRLTATLMRMLRQKLQAEVVAIDELGLNGDATEAEAFAYLAVRAVNGWPLSFPGTTGVPQPMTGGRLHPAPSQAA